MKRWIVALSVLILASCGSLDQPNTDLSYKEAQELIDDSPLLSTTATLRYSFNAVVDSGASAGSELEGEIVAQASDYPGSDYLPAFTVFEGQLGLADGSSLDASGLILGQLLYVFFVNQESNLFIQGRGVVAEDGSIEGPFSAFVGGDWGQGNWQATPLSPGTPNPEEPTNPVPDPEEPTDPTPDPEEPADPTPDPADPGTPDPEEPTTPTPDPEEPGEPEPEDPTDPEEPEEPNPEEPTDPEEPQPEEPAPEEPETPSDLPAPPETLDDTTRNGDPTVTRVFYDDDIAIYFGEGMDPNVDWMHDYVRDMWLYAKDTYGYFGEDPRLYVFVHENSNPGYATIKDYFESGLGYRNVLTLGGSWDWSSFSDTGLEVITHELSHIIEGANNRVAESPSFQFWGDSKWAEIFIYDVYKNIGEDDKAQRWFDKMQVNQGGFQYENAYAFRDWFYPIYEAYGGAEVYDTYFELLAECYPQKDIQVENGETAKEHIGRANAGEVLHFFSGAAGEDLSAQFDTAFGLTSEIQSQLEQAQQELTCANTY